MKTTKSLLAGAALAGIITGGFAAQSKAAVNTGAPQIKKGDNTWTLRDPSGRPLWSGRGQSRGRD